jgi:hypothetical protein
MNKTNGKRRKKEHVISFWEEDLYKIWIGIIAQQHVIGGTKKCLSN